MGNKACLHRFFEKRSLLAPLLRETKLAYTVTLENEACLQCYFGKRSLLTPLRWKTKLVYIATLGNEACLHRYFGKRGLLTLLFWETMLYVYTVIVCIFYRTYCYRESRGRLAMPNEPPSQNKEFHFTYYFGKRSLLTP